MKTTSRRSAVRRGNGAKASHAYLFAGGFSLLELVVVIIVISILFVVAASRLMALQVDAERVAMETIAGSLRSAIGIKVAETIVKQQVRALGMLESGNPMDRLAEVPSNYLGELNRPDPHSLEEGSWYFDKGDRVLVYLVRNRGFFEGGVHDPPRARFAMRLVYTDRNGNGQYDQGVEVIEGVRLAVLEPYQWVK
jgi:prepilin-type N-terminal cleavage/methylation domain-containing protein